jgi:hypothetical protein
MLLLYLFLVFGLWFYFYSGLISLFIVSAWYLPMIYYYVFSTTRPLSYPWGPVTVFLFNHYPLLLIPIAVILAGVYYRKILFPHIVSVFSVLVLLFLFIDVERFNIPIHSDRQLAMVMFLLPILIVYLGSLFLKKKKIIFIFSAIILIFLVFSFTDYKERVRDMFYNGDSIILVDNMLGKYDNMNKLFMSQTFYIGSTAEIVFGSIIGNSGNRFAPHTMRESSVNSIFFTPIRNQFSVIPGYWSTRSWLSENNQFLNQEISNKVQNAKEIGVEYLLSRDRKLKDEYLLFDELVFVEEKEAWAITEIIYNKNEDPNFKLLKNKPILVLSDFETKKYRNRSLDFVTFAEELLFYGEHDINIVLGENTTKSLEDFSFVFVEEKYYKDYPKKVGKLLEKNENIKFFLPMEGDNFKNDSKDDNLIFYSPTSKNHYGEYYMGNMFALIKDNLVEIEIADYNEISFQDNRDSYTITNNSDKDIQVLIKRSYFPTWFTYSGQEVKLINPNFIAIKLKAGETEFLYFNYPKVFYIGHLVSLFGIILLASIAFRRQG